MSNWLTTPKSKSRTKTFVRTLPPQILAAAVSRGNPLRPRTPATAHADRWWPKTSRRRPHRQTRAVRGSGRRKRWRNNTFKTCGSKRVARLVGKLTNGAEANGPPWDVRLPTLPLSPATPAGMVLLTHLLEKSRPPVPDPSPPVPTPPRRPASASRLLDLHRLCCNAFLRPCNGWDKLSDWFQRQPWRAAWSPRQDLEQSTRYWNINLGQFRKEQITRIGKNKILLGEFISGSC